MMKFLRGHPLTFNFLLFLLCVSAAFAMRTHNYNREAEAVARIVRDAPAPELSFFRKFLPAYHRNFMPYTIECAMMFGYTQDIAAGKSVPASDPGLRGLEDIAPFRQMIMGLEWFLGYGYRVKCLLFGKTAPTSSELAFQDNPDLANFVPVQLRLWISLSSGFLFLLLIVLGCRRRYALFGGLFHAVAISAVARSTGQDIIRGNFAMPFITAFLLLFFSILGKPARWKFVLLFVSVFGAFSFWDLSLGLFSAFAIFEIVRFAFTGKVSGARRDAWLMTTCAIVPAAILIPFNRAYLVVMSPLVLVLLPALLAAFYAGARLGAWKRVLFVCAMTGGLFLVWHFAVRTPEYVSNYSHFSELTKAKVKFGNVKPRDPSKLSYDARIMWTPAMHSADWRTIRTMFPALSILTGLRRVPNFLAGILSIPLALGSFYLLLLAAPLFSRTARRVRRHLNGTLFFYVFTVVFTAGFIYVVRYHEFLIFFLAVSLPLLLRDFLASADIVLRTPRKEGRIFSARSFSAVLKRALPVLCAAILLLETAVSLFGERVYSNDVHLRQTAALIRWFRSENVRGKCVITDFAVGPMLKCYAGTAIAMQPQFGLERIRKPTETYLRLLYHGTEVEFAEFCSGLGADFVVHNAGYLGPMHIYSERYIANAKHIRGTSPVNMMRYAPGSLKWFYRIRPPYGFSGISSVYSVFKVISPKNRMDAMKLAFAGERELADGRRQMAERYARAAFILDPASPHSLAFYRRVFGCNPRYTLSGLAY